MPNILQTLESLPIGKISASLDTAHGATHFSADAMLDPEFLLGDLGKVLKEAKFPSSPAEITDSIKKGFGELQNFAQLPDLGILGDIGNGLSDLVAIIEKFAGTFNGDLTQMAEHLLSGSGGLDDLLKQSGEQLMQMLPLNHLDDLIKTLADIHALVNHQLQKPEEVAEIVAQFVVGASLDELSAPGSHLDDFLGKIRSSGGDFAPVATAINGLTTRVRAATSMIMQSSPEAPLNADAVVTEIQQISAALDLLASSTIPGALGKLTTDLAALDPGPLFDKATAAMEALLDKIPNGNFDFVSTITETVGQMLLAIADTTEADLKDKFQSLHDGLTQAVNLSGVAGATADIDLIFDYIVGLIERIPLLRLRQELIDFLTGIEVKIRGFAGFSVLQGLRDQAKKIGDAIDHVDTAAIQQKVQGIVKQINDLIGKFPIQEINTEVTALVGQVTGIVQQLQPLFDQVNKELDGLAQQVTQIDLSGAGQAAIGLMHQIRTDVEKVAGSSDLPEPVKAAIGAGAGALKSLNLAVDITDPFNKALAQVDPSLVLAPVKPVLAKVQDTLNKVTPAALVAELDGPFDQLMKELDRLKPANLLAAMTGEFGRFLDMVAHGNPQDLLAPLEAEFEKLIDIVRKALDPAPLFAPLHAAYAKFQDLLKQLDIGKLLGALMERLSDVPGGMSDSLKGAMTSRGFSPGSGLPQATMGDLKMGDFLRPITHFLNQLRLQITALAHDLLERAWDLLRKPIQVLDELAQPALGIVGKLAQEVDARLASLDLFSPGGPAADLRQAVEDLITAQHSIQGNAEMDAKLGPAVAQLDLGGRFTMLAAPRQSAEVQRQRFHQSTPPPGLYAAAQAVNGFYGALFPDSLRSDAPVNDIMALLNGLLDKFDLTPLADKLDQAGDQAMAKIKSLFTTLMQGIFGLVDAGFGILNEFMPAGIVDRFNQGIARIGAEFNVLDPTPIEAEVRAMVDALLTVFDQFSPKSLGVVFGAVFDALKNKINILNPVTLLGDLTAIDNILAQFGQLKPSIVLAPLVASTAGLTDTLKKVATLNVGDTVNQAIANLKGQLEDIVAGLQQELQALLDYLEGLAGGSGGSVAISASVG